MIMDKALLEEFSEKLTSEKNRLQYDLDRLAKPVDGAGEYETQMENIGNDEEENTSEVEQYVDNLAVESTLESQLHKVLEAIDRIEDGSYGKCVVCGEDIDIERLRAYPAAQTCMKHAQ